jgi:putative ABC transport system substrate-binding protein
MKRREFIAGLGSAAAWPMAARAQQRRVPAIGYLSNQIELSDQSAAAAYRRGLGEQGYIEGQNVEIMYRYTDARGNRRRAVAEDLARNGVSVICAAGGPADVEAAKAASATIPIVFLTGGDPIQAGIVASLSRPGGNVTGVTFLSQELVPKRLELLHEVAPSATSIGFLTAAGDPGITEAEKAARALGVRLALANPSTSSEIDAAFTALVEQGIGAFLGGRQGLFFVTAPQLVALAAHLRFTPSARVSRPAVS